MMPTRRSLLLVLTCVTATAGARDAYADAASAATDFISQLMQKLASVVNSDQPNGQKQAALEQLVDTSVDVPEVARFCLGRFWRIATQAQQEQYVDVFHRTLVNSVAGKVGEYRGVSYTIGRASPRDDTIVVPTTVTRPSNAPSKVEWIVSTASGAPKIVDLIAEGVSLRITQRSDYASYLARNNNSVQSLIDALRRQANNPQG